MAQMDLLRTFLSERLHAVADEIFGVVKITITEYERELSSSKEETERLNRIVELLKPKITLHDIDNPATQDQTAVESLVNPEPQQQCPAWVRELPKPPYLNQDPGPLLLLKEERQERWPCAEQQGPQEQNGFWSREERVLQGPDEDEEEEEEEQNEPWPGEGEDRLSTLKEEVETSLIAPANDHGVREHHDDTQSTHGAAAGERDDDGVVVAEHLRPTTSKDPPGSAGRLGDSEEDRWISAAGHQSNSPSRCKVCGKLVDSIHALLDHVEQHAGEERHPCGVCGHHFLSPDKLLRHVHYHRTRNVCPICGKCVCRLRRHMMIHTGEKPYRCRFCGLGFAQFTNMRSHVQTHTGEKPFKCKVCGKAFHRKANVKLHMRVHAAEKVPRGDPGVKVLVLPHGLPTHAWGHANDKPAHHS